MPEVGNEKSWRKISYVEWEEGGFVLTINGCKLGMAIDDEEEMKRLVEYFEYSLEEILQNFGAIY